MASWKLFWLSQAPFFALAVYATSRTTVAKEFEADNLSATEFAVIFAAVAATAIIWGMACDALARERFSRWYSRCLTALCSFFFPIVFVLIFLAVPNRRNSAD